MLKMLSPSVQPLNPIKKKCVSKKVGLSAAARRKAQSGQGGEAAPAGGLDASQGWEWRWEGRKWASPVA